jgi:DNA polymerase-3 subunit gamma/tau
MTAQLAQHAAVQAWDGKVLTLVVQPEVASMIGSRSAEKLEQAVQQFQGTAVKLRLVNAETDAKLGESKPIDTPAVRTADAQAQRQQQAEHSIMQEPMIQAMRETFEAEVVPGSVKAISK